eukprot:TRINITY_DN2474_c0_g1_i1.p1 TRINITY_DN2474_c0_g1~~TRINITY_DN2474_c0_g1_i1.p1  ORF type:complete len:121 (-),score=18.14 TRINITY_DN2474_c0_g1_i1:67-429(-)
MKYFLALLFVAASSGSPLGYYPLNLIQYELFGPCSQVCVSPPCTCTQPVVITLPGDGEGDFECETAGSFPNRENACKSYFVCIKKNETEGFLLTERACNPSLAFDTNLGVCNWEQAVTDC